MQKAPELFETIKMMCDETDECGLFWLTGSESRKLLKEAGESMAGRVCILRMYSLSQREKLGLCAYLCMWTSRDTLMNGAANGHYFENYVVGEFLRTYTYSPQKVNMTFYRDMNQKEIDLVIEREGKLHPIEIKRSSFPEKKAIKSFGLLEKSSQEVANGGIVCMTDRVFPLDERNIYIPCNII